MIAMALAAAVTVSAVPVDAYAASPYSKKMARAVQKSQIRKSIAEKKLAGMAEEVVVVSEEMSADNDAIDIVVQIPEASAEETAADTVDVPMTSVDDPETEEIENQNTVLGDPVGTVTQEGDLPEYPGDDEYNYTESTVTQQGSITATTEEITVTETVTSGSSNMEYIASEVTPDADNDLTIESGSVLVQGIGEVTPKDGYEYVYLGTGNLSQFFAAYLYTEPGSENEEPVYTDAEGNSYYNHGTTDRAKYYVEGLFLNGEQVESEDQAYLTNRSGALQFVMYDPATGKFNTTYCADLMTNAELNYSYNIENLEQADYYTEEEAAMIRTVASNGYWGTDATVYETDENGDFILDDNGNKIAKRNADGSVVVDVTKTGSLEAVKEMMRNAYETDENGEVKTDDAGNPIRIFSDDEVAALTDGMALTATQYAVWTFSNKMNDIEFVNVQYSAKNANNFLSGTWKDIPQEDVENNSVDLIFKLYEHLINMAPTPIEEKQQTTENTIINAENFLEDLSVTVVEKVTEHDNNLDDDDTNDVYTTNVSFALVVTPSTENGDDLVVSVVDAAGNILASGRVAGENKEDEDYKTLEADENGNYTFSNIVMTEGEQNFNITLEGIQNLEQGVYLYTSEVRGTTSSQTMVGMAEGEHAVEVSMNIKFELSVDDEVVATERISRSKISQNDPETTPEEPIIEELGEIEEPDVPLTDLPETPADTEEPVVDIAEGDVPMADAPEEPLVAGEEESIIAETGDSNHMAAGFAGMLAALAGMVGLKRRKEN